MPKHRIQFSCTGEGVKGPRKKGALAVTVKIAVLLTLQQADEAFISSLFQRESP